MDNETKELQGKLVEATQALQKSNDLLLKEKEEGRQDPLLKESVEKANKDITALQEKFVEAGETIKSQEEEILKMKRDAGWSKSEQSEKAAYQKSVSLKALAHGPESLSPEDRKAHEEIQLQTKEMFSGSDSNGGFTIVPEFDLSITGLVKENSPIRQIADAQTIGSNAWQKNYQIARFGARWVGEREARPKSTTGTLGQIEIPVHELQATPSASTRLLDDSQEAIEAWFNSEVADEFSISEGAAFVSGDGNKKPKGFLSYASGTGFNQIEQVTSAVSATVDFDDVIALQTKLLPAFRQNAKFVMSKETEEVIRLLKDGEGNYLWQIGAQAGTPSTLGGYPIVIAVDMPTVASSSLSIAFGDFRRGYKIVDRLGLRILRDPYTDKPNVLFDTFKRVGGGVQNFQAIKLLKTKA